MDRNPSGIGRSYLDRHLNPERGFFLRSCSELSPLIPFFIILAYLVSFWGWRGQTPGKMVMRLKITRIDGSDIDWGAAILRLLGYVISFLIVFIGHFWILNDSHRQGLHDKIADTYVIKLPRK